MDLRRVLYGLYAILRLHFAQEEEAYAWLASADEDVGVGRRLGLRHHDRVRLHRRVDLRAGRYRGCDGGHAERGPAALTLLDPRSGRRGAPRTAPRAQAPRPTPADRRRSRPCGNGSKIASRVSAGTPGPSSSTTMSAPSSARSTRTQIRASPGVCFTALRAGSRRCARPWRCRPAISSGPCRPATSGRATGSELATSSTRRAPRYRGPRTGLDDAAR